MACLLIEKKKWTRFYRSVSLVYLRLVVCFGYNQWIYIASTGNSKSCIASFPVWCQFLLVLYYICFYIDEQGYEMNLPCRCLIWIFDRLLISANLEVVLVGELCIRICSVICYFASIQCSCSDSGLYWCIVFFFCWGGDNTGTVWIVFFKEEKNLWRFVVTTLFQKQNHYNFS